jgi:uncharacterized protein YkwD
MREVVPVLLAVALASSAPPPAGLVSPAPAAAGSDRGSAARPADDPERRLLAAVNRERARRGRPPLAADPRLAAAAAAHSRAMAERGFFDHCDPDTGSLPWRRVEDAGYLWRAVGENVAAGRGEPGEVLDQWLDSRGHRDNLLSRDFVAAGIGYASDPDDRFGVRLDRDGDCAPDRRGGPYRHYWTMVFAAPSPHDPGGREEGDR